VYGYIVMHRNGKNPSMHPTTKNAILNMKHTFFTKLMMDRAL